MRFLRASDYTGATAWDALDIERFQAASVRLHWTDKAYIWHENDGPEVFAVLDGRVRMHWRDEAGREDLQEMLPGDLVHCTVGDVHKAEPIGPARVLVIETPGSI